jgi:hypothetical protein
MSWPCRAANLVRFIFLWSLYSTFFPTICIVRISSDVFDDNFCGSNRLQSTFFFFLSIWGDHCEEPCQDPRGWSWLPETEKGEVFRVNVTSFLLFPSSNVFPFLCQNKDRKMCVCRR